MHDNGNPLSKKLQLQTRWNWLDAFHGRNGTLLRQFS